MAQHFKDQAKREKVSSGLVVTQRFCEFSQQWAGRTWFLTPDGEWMRHGQVCVIWDGGRSLWKHVVCVRFCVCEPDNKRSLQSWPPLCYRSSQGASLLSIHSVARSSLSPSRLQSIPRLPHSCLCLHHVDLLFITGPLGAAFMFFSLSLSLFLFLWAVVCSWNHWSECAEITNRHLGYSVTNTEIKV